MVERELEIVPYQEGFEVREVRRRGQLMPSGWPFPGVDRKIHPTEEAARQALKDYVAQRNEEERKFLRKERCLLVVKLLFFGSIALFFTIKALDHLSESGDRRFGAWTLSHDIFPLFAWGILALRTWQIVRNGYAAYRENIKDIKPCEWEKKSKLRHVPPLETVDGLPVEDVHKPLTPEEKEANWIDL